MISSRLPATASCQNIQKRNRPAPLPRLLLAKIAAQVLREMGFDPVQRPDTSVGSVRELGLNACPFITAQGERPEPVICAMHEGFLDEGIGDVQVELRPHDRPGQCGARLTKRG